MLAGPGVLPKGASRPRPKIPKSWPAHPRVAPGGVRRYVLLAERVLPVAILVVAMVGAPVLIFSPQGLPRLRQLQKELYPSGEGSHATASEVALTWFKYPETMNRTPLEPRIAPNGSFADAEDYRRAFPDGRIGSDPSQATPEHGKRFYDAAVEEVARDYERWVAR